MADPFSCDVSYRPGAAPTLDTTQVNATLPNEFPADMRVQDAILGWLRWHFGDTSRIVYDQLKARVYTPNDKTQILIQSLAEYSPPVASGRPAILVNTDQQEPKSHSLGNNRFMGGCGVGNLRDYRSILWEGRHVVHCIGGREGEGQLLAAEVFQELNEFAPKMKNALCLVRLLVTARGARRKLEEFNETWTVPIGLMYGYWTTWRINDLQAGDLSQIQIGTTLS